MKKNVDQLINGHWPRNCLQECARLTSLDRACVDCLERNDKKPCASCETFAQFLTTEQIQHELRPVDSRMLETEDVISVALRRQAMRRELERRAEAMKKKYYVRIDVYLDAGNEGSAVDFIQEFLERERIEHLIVASGEVSE